MYFKNTRIFLLIPFAILFFYSCNPPDDKTDLVNQNIRYTHLDSLFIIADTLTFDALYDSSNSYLIYALNMYSKEQDFDNVVKAMNKISFNYRKMGQLDSSFSYLNNASEIAKLHLDTMNINLAETYHNQGILYRNIGEVDKAMELFNASLKIRKAKLTPDDLLIGDSYNNIGIICHIKNDFVHAEEYYKRALAVRKKGLGANHPSVASTYNNIAIFYEDLSDYENALIYYDSVLTIRINAFGFKHPEVADLLINMGDFYDKIGLLDSAMSYSNRALEIYKNILTEDNESVAAIYNNMGTYYNRKGDFTTGIEYHKRALSVRKKLYKTPAIELAKSYNNLGETYFELKNFEKAEENLLLALRIIKQFYKDKSLNEAAVNIDLSNVYKAIGDRKKALEYLQNAVKIRTEIYSINHPSTAYALMSLADYYYEIGNLDEAEKNAGKAIEIFSSNYKTGHYYLAEAYLVLANVMQKKHQLNKALEYIDRALIALSQNEKNFKIDQLIHSASQNRISLLNSLSKRGEIYKQLYLEKNLKEDLSESLNSYLYAMDVINKIRREFVFESSRFKIGEITAPIISAAIESAYFSFKNENDEKSFNNALTFAESNKAVALSEIIFESNALKFGKVPDSLILEEKKIKSALDYFSNAHDKASLSGDKAEIEEYEKKLFELRSKYEKLIKTLENKYSSYYEMKYSDNAIKISDLQKNLDKDRTFIEYFIDERFIYTLVISHYNKTLSRIENPKDFDGKIKELRKSIASNDYAVYSTIAFELYSILIKPVESKFNSNRLVIAIDGILGYLPFETLLTSRAEKKNDFKALNYLVKKYAISYTYSAALFVGSSNNKEFREVESFLGIAAN
ncbi:MAG: tetratricopeptide repeat protein [bacterium]